jgi:flagellar hook protein FlgE
LSKPSSEAQIGFNLPAKAGEGVSSVLNFDPSDQLSFDNSAAFMIHDSLGDEHLLSMYFVRLAQQSSEQSLTPWAFFVTVDEQPVNILSDNPVSDLVLVDVNNNGWLEDAEISANAEQLVFSTVNAATPHIGTLLSFSSDGQLKEDGRNLIQLQDLSFDDPETSEPADGAGILLAPAQSQKIILNHYRDGSDVSTVSQYAANFAVTGLMIDGYSTGEFVPQVNHAYSGVNQINYSVYTNQAGVSVSPKIFSFDDTTILQQFEGDYWYIQTPQKFNIYTGGKVKFNTLVIID